MAPNAQPDPRDARDPQTLLAIPLRILHVALIVGLAAASALNFAFGFPTTGMATAIGAAVCALAWRIAAAGRIDASAAITFYMIVAILGTLVFLGHGTRDYGLIAMVATVFAASVFLPPRAYWVLAAVIIGGATLLGVAEMAGWFHPRPVPATGAREILNLLIIIGASTLGGRALTIAIRSAFARERALSGALRSSQDRIQKIFRSSQNPIVVSSLANGRYIEGNDAYMTLFGFCREEVVGRTAVELRVWEDAGERDRFVALLRERGAVRDYATRMRKRSGEIIEAVLSAELTAVGDEPCLLVTVTDVTAQRDAERRAEFLASRDSLTGLPNRVAALDRLEHAMQRAVASGRAIAVLHLGIDRFKAINESLGYSSGDALIRQVAARLKATMSPGDTLARIAADEFLVVAESPAGPDEAGALAQRLIDELRQPLPVAGREIRVTLSAGVAVGPDYAIDAERLLRRADSAMHIAKSEGRGQFRLYDKAMDARVRDRVFLESSLRESLSRGGLRLAYQPKFALGSRQVTGLEALARWRHAELGEIAPSVFIPVAEESELIHDLGAWVLAEACGQLARWRAQGLACVPVAVNLSAMQFTPELPLLIADSARMHGLDPGLVEIEVTESMLIKSPEAARRLLQQITARGSRVVLDDFGVGYSSLGYIKQLDLHGIKIDRSFIRDLVGSRHDVAIVRAILGLAHGLGLRVVAEGVESEAQVQILKDLGCDEAQGFHFSRPLSGEDIAAGALLAPRQVPERSARVGNG